MISQYNIGSPQLNLMSDPAGESPIYIYYDKNSGLLLYCESLAELLNDSRVPKPLKISKQGLSFMLQSSIVPPPNTIYENIYIIGIGDSAKVLTSEGGISLKFDHEFPFMLETRTKIDSKKVDFDYVLEVLSDATISRLDSSKNSFLFHSAGKDSNAIALALAEGGYQDKFTLVTHKSKGKADESEISKKIAKKLGFKHRILNEIDELGETHIKEVNFYQSKQMIPCVDNVVLAYPLYVHQLPDLKSANIIFGDGNDSYMLTPPNTRQNMVFPFSKFMSKFRFINSFINSESRIFPALRTPAEWFGLSGFSYSDSRKVFANSIDVYEYWKNESEIRNNWDLFEFKSDIYSTRIITEKMIRKLRGFCEAYESNLVLPFCDQRIVEYSGTLPETELFCRKTLRNKIFLRDLLKQRLGLDSDSIGKMGWTYDSKSLVKLNYSWMRDEILECDFWSKPQMNAMITRLIKGVEGSGWSADSSARLIYRLYTLSAWKNLAYRD